MKPTIPTTFQMEWDRVSGAFEDLKEQVHERGREGERNLQGIQVDPWNGLSHEFPQDDPKAEHIRPVQNEK